LSPEPISDSPLRVLDTLGIPYTLHEHPPVFTVEEAEQYWADIHAAHCKNLFLRNQKGTRHYLVVLDHRKQADLKKLNIDAKLLDVEPALYETEIQSGKLVMMTHAYGRSARDPGTTLTGAKAWYAESEGGWNHYEGAEYARLRKEMQSTLDRPTREKLARQIQQLMLDEAFTNPVAGVPRMWVYGNYVKGLTYNMDNYIFAGDVWLAK
jgi:ABC-type oligopeptide transport system substrate-binding subunit